MLVVCNGMIRSGSTLQYNLAREILGRSGKRPLVAHGFLPPNEVEALGPTFAEWGRDEAWHLLKVHRVLPQAADLARENRLLLCYVYRDLRDVAASLRLKWNDSLEDVLRRLDEAVQVSDEVGKLAGGCVQRYENLMDQPRVAIQELSSFLGTELTVDDVSAIERACSLETATNITGQLTRALTLRQRIARYIRRHDRGLLARLVRLLGMVPRLRALFPPELPIDTVRLLHSDHISRNQGAVGRFGKVLSPKEVACIESRYENWLREHGYTSATEAGSPR